MYAECFVTNDIAILANPKYIIRAVNILIWVIFVASITSWRGRDDESPYRKTRFRAGSGRLELEARREILFYVVSGVRQINGLVPSRRRSSKTRFAWEESSLENYILRLSLFPHSEETLFRISLNNAPRWILTQDHRLRAIRINQFHHSDKFRLSIATESHNIDYASFSCILLKFLFDAMYWWYHYIMFRQFGR